MFDRNGMYLVTKKIEKNNQKAAEIEVIILNVSDGIRQWTER